MGDLFSMSLISISSLTMARVARLVRGVLMAVMVGGVVGSVSAGFLWLLDGATRLQGGHGWLLWCLPVLGMLVAWMYGRWGRDVVRGTCVILDEHHLPDKGVPPLMAPLVLVGTLLTHLGGGSAGREGTAVQMGGSLAATLARVFRAHASGVYLWLAAGMAGGFGAVFGTPIAGAVFAMEVVVAGRLNMAVRVPALVASVVGHLTCLAWGTVHTDYRSLVPDVDASWSLLGKILLAGLAFGLLGRGFVGISHGVQKQLSRWIPWPIWRPAFGGLVVILLVYAMGTRDFLGLGVESASGSGVSILSCFHDGGATPWSWLWKLIFTVVTLASGFKGGEVTPLFFIGAAAGHALGVLGHEPVGLFAALGLIALFSSAAKTPLTGAVLGVELFGAPVALYGTIACVMAYLVSGKRGLYAAQRRTGDVPSEAGH